MILVPISELESEMLLRAADFKSAVYAYSTISAYGAVSRLRPDNLSLTRRLLCLLNYNSIIKHDLHAVSYSASRPTNSTSSSAMFMPAISHRQLLWWTRVLRPAPDIKHGLHALAKSPLALASHPHPRRHLMLFAEIWLFGHSAVANYSLGIASFANPNPTFRVSRLTSFIMALGTPYDCPGT